MAEEKLSRNKGKVAKGRIAGLFLALFAILVLGIWLLRQPIAEAVARGVCEAQRLSCKLSVTRLDFGGVTLTGIDARAPGAANAAVAAEDIVIDLAWDGLFSPRPSVVSGKALSIRLDLTGKRSVFGDLETAINTFTKPTEQKPGPLPRLQFADLTVIADTVSGPVLAKGKITAANADAFTVDLAATPAAFGVSGAKIDLSAAQLNATVAGQDISAALKLDLASFAAEGANISDVKVDASLQQSAGTLKAEGAARLGVVNTKDVELANASANATLEVAAMDAGENSLGKWIAGIRRLRVDATAGEGAFGGASWTKATLATLIQPLGEGRSGGDISLMAENLHAPRVAASQLGLKGKVEIAGGRVGNADGMVTVRGGVIPAPQRANLVNDVAGVLDSVLPAYADALRRALDRAGQAFEADIPWSVRSTDEGLTLYLIGGAKVKSASGMTLTATAKSDTPTIASYTVAADNAWTTVGVLGVQGGGAPPVVLDIASGTGKGGEVALTGTASLRPWKVGSDTISADLENLSFSAKDAVGQASGRLNLEVDGGLGGGVWKGARARAEVSAKWDAGTFVADAPAGAGIKWDRASYGGSIFGVSELHYSPAGHLAELKGEGLAGRGKLAAVSMPVDGDGYAARVSLGATAIDWRTAGGFHAGFDMEPAAVNLKLDVREIPIRIGDISGALELGKGWRVAGGFTKASVETAEGNVVDLGGKFDLGGVGDDLSGSLTGLVMRLADPLTENRRYEDVNFRGEAMLRNGVADFSGTFTMAKSGMQVAHVVGRHNLDDNAGALAFEPTPLIFRPRQFQPSDLSPMLVGPANVTGRLDVAGAASWNVDGLKASGVLDLNKLGFALASAGVFEGVSGHVEVADLLNMKSVAGQRITIDKVTLGLPIEKGEIAFQLIGYDAIQLESAQWPFGGGFIRIDPERFVFASEAQNRIVARAVDWDLAKLSDQFKLPDMKLSGVVGGEFPVVFTTGSAEIDHAVLKSTKPGVIQYSGSTGDAAAQADANSKMLFDALKDFRYQVLQMGINGNLTGQMMVTVSLLGANPDVLSGQPFQLNIGIDSALVPLITSTMQKPDVRTAIGQAREAQQ